MTMNSEVRNRLIQPILNVPKQVIMTYLIILFAAFNIYADPVSDAQAGDGNNGVTASATGGGHYLIGGSIEVKFSFSAKQNEGGFATGQFRQSLIFNGDLIDFHGEVTCVTVDSANHRAWIGGIVTQNNSESPSFTGAIHQPGKDVWFRVLDSGEGNEEVDRTTFLGFEGGGGIITSEEYCAAAIWPDDNARTSPVTQGNIQVRP